MKYFVAIFLVLCWFSSFSASAEPIPKEVLDFKIDKKFALARAVQSVTNGHPENAKDHLNIAHAWFGSIKGTNCQGKSAKYILVVLPTLAREFDFFEFVIFDVSSARWKVLTGGAESSIQSIIYILRDPDFKNNGAGMCGD